MITKINLQNVANIGNDPAVLETDKRINLIYGLNGSGKTTISRFLAMKNDKRFAFCSLEGTIDEKILVYNQDFVERNFYEKDEINGIFTLSSTNKDAEKQIKIATDKIREINLQLENQQTSKGLKYDLKKKQEEKRKLRDQIEQEVWSIKEEYYGGDRILEFCLNEFNKREKAEFFNKFLNLKKPEKEPTVSIGQLKEEAIITQSEKTVVYDENEIQKITFDFSLTENDSIFKEAIIGNENSAVSTLIKQLENSDWVKLGLKYLPDSIEKNEICPFCQEKTITPSLFHQIKNYFDDIYEEKLRYLKELEDQYWKAWEAIPKKETYLENPFVKKREKDFILLYNNLNDKLRSNWWSIKEKREKVPAKIISLESSLLDIKVLNDFFDLIIQEIKIHNSKVNNKSQHKKEIINNFWDIMRWDYDKNIVFFTNQNKTLEDEICSVNKQIIVLELERKKYESIIENTQREIINIDGAIRNINTGLLDLGIQGFKIEKVEESYYKIKREANDDEQFKTLSEGEKTIISFLYFIELCKGKENENEVLMNKIVVIDDPVSSLSHLFLFNISQLIKYTFIDNNIFTQIFILTHSLYFFHELIKIGPKTKDDKYKFDGKIFRIVRSRVTKINPMQQNEILNDYQAYWQIIKDHNANNAHDALLANAMRNILEYFFGFIESMKFHEAIGKIDPKKYQAFIRYINRESHSDFTNISDMKEIDSDIFKIAFKEVFCKAGYEEHYAKMIGS